MTEIVWEQLWTDVTRRLGAHVAAGRGHLITEDTVRMEAVLALGAEGVSPSRLKSEVFVEGLAGGKVDLVVDPPDGAVIEFKYPRDSRTGISPDTMTFGELIRDFLRVAVVGADQRWVVQVLNTRLLRYLLRVRLRHELHWSVTPGEILELHPEAVAGLPETAARAIGTAGVSHLVTARCVVAEPIADDLGLYAYVVDSASGTAGPVSIRQPAALPTQPLRAAAASADGSRVDAGIADSLDAPSEVSVPVAAREGARRSILDAAGRVMATTGRTTFTISEVMEDLRARGSDYADQTIRTMIGAHMNADATGTGVSGYTDVVRVSRGEYRLR